MMYSEVMRTAEERLLIDRFGLPRVERREDGCWVWMGSRDEKGYGRLNLVDMSRSAHRASYELFVGPVPEGMVLDHLCRNTSCINPDHLEPVTNFENSVVRGNVGQKNRDKATCPRGHEYDAMNSQGRRICRECGRAASRRYYNKTKEV